MNLLGTYLFIQIAMALLVLTLNPYGTGVFIAEVTTEFQSGFESVKK